ncbi:HAD-IA family hydrolase [Sulfitobacter donghicola]|uniref:HAD family hydrolase n=1 Tax=Sulfitobacter donghicola DSW-25 = KCTC 12864 = JCM 14565 TaxID=1300350 RepID=A0A073IGN0_9RHOB|nr:HAD-IA family hydrolase [Sulfitobacter donghicola]KEJ88656.1 HAD family hydrolase [Sulfitobacter donghicola DSW-25 = KCTC 12864 = JCM 14565]KIN68424.1 HAD-superfamily hydrolase, subfamily IA, variant 1 [Sulfitobacter donghicola DSW-25 = KCTC 12864 = JCM 14565]
MSDKPLRLVIFDVDGTLVDSQAHILGAMHAAFADEGLETPQRSDVLGVVGLSLDVLMPRLAPDADQAAHARLVQGYKDAYMAIRAEQTSAVSSPFYPGARETLEALHAQPEVLLGVATGKSRRGLDKLIEGHGLEGMFVTQQVADFHPSKPSPAMLLEALKETGIEASDAVMIGDTSFDMEMARAAGIAGVGVSWGYHPRENLSAARTVIDSFQALPSVLDEIWKG